jgi:hypothetical protein
VYFGRALYFVMGKARVKVEIRRITFFTFGVAGPRLRGSTKKRRLIFWAGMKTTVEKKISKYKPRLFPRIFALVMSLSSSLVCAATKCTKVNQQ